MTLYLCCVWVQTTISTDVRGCLAEYILSQSGHGSYGGPPRAAQEGGFLWQSEYITTFSPTTSWSKAPHVWPIATQEHSAPRPSRRLLAHGPAVHQQAVGEPQSLKKGAGIMQTIMRRTVLTRHVQGLATLLFRRNQDMKKLFLAALIGLSMPPSAAGRLHKCARGTVGGIFVKTDSNTTG